ncbi:membrane cofactor protein isoform X3 [Falco biarmicus]|uniref:membrane cofactor protein isoform X3 n=1 Tax=Falco biarmicus TaxID=345155 RepID=UPI0024BCD771|nr:membrane cofactor protein isoform X3 [Falco biarmicus]
MGSGRRRSPLPALLVLLVLLVLPPAAWSDCGPLPTISHAEPPEDSKHQGSFSVGSRITYSCHRGYIKRPLLSDTIQCLTNSQWSNLPEFCGRSCLSPPRVHFARISQEDEIKNFYAVNVTVKYNCRPGYENTTAQLPTSMCLDDLSWSEVPELCRRKSCGIPENPEYGKVITSDHLFGARAEVVCNRGYTLKGASRIIRCSIRGSEVGWSQLPTCQAISCSPPPAIRNGTHNGSGTEEFTYNSVVMYTCEPGLQLVGNETLHCTTENQVDGVWSESPPECRVSTTAATNQTKPSEEKIGGNPYWLVSILIPSCIVALGILAGIIMRCNDNKIQSYDMGLQKHEMKGRDPPTHPKGPDDEKQPLPWHSYFCHTTSCHVCPTCEEQLHAALAPHAEPPHRGCAACEDWLSTQPGTPRTLLGPPASAAGTARAQRARALLPRLQRCWGVTAQEKLFRSGARWSSPRTVKAATTSAPSVRTGCAPTLASVTVQHLGGGRGGPAGRTRAHGVPSAPPAPTGCTSPLSTATGRAAPCVPWPARGPWLTLSPTAPPAATSAPSARCPPTHTCASPSTQHPTVGTPTGDTHAMGPPTGGCKAEGLQHVVTNPN